MLYLLQRYSAGGLDYNPMLAAFNLVWQTQPPLTKKSDNMVPHLDTCNLRANHFGHSPACKGLSEFERSGVRFLGRIAHTPTHVRIDRQVQGFDENSTIERDILQVDGFRSVIDGRFSRLRVG